MTVSAKQIGPSKDFYRKESWLLLREMVFAYWGRQCLRCGSVQNIHVDHVVPRSKAPELALDFHNLQPLCEHCNIEKSNRSCADYRDPSRKNPSDELVLFALRVYRAGSRRPPSVRSVTQILPVVCSLVEIAFQNAFMDRRA